MTGNMFFRYRIDISKKLFFLVMILVVNSGYLYSQSPSAYVDENGVMRWSSDNHEIRELGVNYTLPFSYAYWAHKQLGIPHEKAIDEDVYHISRLGLTAYRIHVWDSEISDTVGNLLDNDHLRLLDYTLKKMKERSFKIILTPIAFWNGIPEEGKKLPGFSFKYGKNNSYTNPGAIKAAENYLFQFMNHKNRYTGIAYKDDPDIIAFEISNEPEHPTEAAEQTTVYINTLVKSIRNSGCRKPLFYCMSIAPRLLQAFLKADIQGGSVQWYSFGLLAGQTTLGNFLTNIDCWPKDSITGPIKERKKALIAYEFDAADNGYTYTYPVMARELRKAGVQFASQFTYDPIHLAYANTEYQTHYMNLAYAPQKALSLKIAGEVFRRVPMGKAFGTYPDDTLFDAFRVSYIENLAEMRTDEKFMYANSTLSKPTDAAKLKEIAGYGSSPVVGYHGRGAYFLDKLENGVWRLEVMPDATWVSDPFARPNLNKQVSAIVWNTWPMTIDLPDLGGDFDMTGINSGNAFHLTAINKKINVSPGTYLLVQKGRKSKWNPWDKWKNITLNEFVAPPATKESYFLHQPLEEITKGSSYSLNAEVISAQKPESVELFISGSGQTFSRPLAFKEVSRYAYIVSVPDNLLQNEGFLKYQIVVKANGKVKTYPGGVETSAFSREFYSNEFYSTRIVSASAPVCMLDVARDNQTLRRPHRRFSFIFRPSLLPGKMGLVMDAANMSYTSFFFRDKIGGRQSDLVSKKQLVLRGLALGSVPVSLWVSLQLKDGSEYGDTVSLTKDQILYKLPLEKFQRIQVDGPGEKGPVTIKLLLNKKTKLNLQEAETIKITVIPTDDDSTVPQCMVEYVILE